MESLILSPRSFRLTFIEERANHKAEEYCGDGKTQQKNEDKRWVTVLNDWHRFYLTKQSGSQLSHTLNGITAKQKRRNETSLNILIVLVKLKINLREMSKQFINYKRSTHLDLNFSLLRD